MLVLLDAVALYEQHKQRIDAELASREDLYDVDRGLAHQNENPVKLLTSGPEERTEEPITAGGKVRHERRVRWWNDYSDEPLCVFGHYSVADGIPRGGEAAFCVDYGVGKRWMERRAGKTSGFAWKLAAVRFPERVVVFDEGGEHWIAEKGVAQK